LRVNIDPRFHQELAVFRRGVEHDADLTLLEDARLVAEHRSTAHRRVIDKDGAAVPTLRCFLELFGSDKLRCSGIHRLNDTFHQSDHWHHNVLAAVELLPSGFHRTGDSGDSV